MMKTVARITLFCSVLIVSAEAQSSHRVLIYLPEVAQDVEVRFTTKSQSSSVVHFRVGTKSFALTANFGIYKLNAPDTPQPLMLPDKTSGFRFSAGHAFLVAQYED